MLIRRKLEPPRLRPGLVSRPALIARLESGLAGSLILVDAPAGWGKTTLLAEWIDAPAGDTSIAWLSLDPRDDDPARFWAHVVEALRIAVPEIELPPPPSPGIAGGDVTPALIAGLANALAGSPRHVALVLDDFHAVTATVIHDGLGSLVDLMPGRATLVIATRADPPWRLGGMRARGDMTEVRAADLRFSAAEAGALLAAAAGPGVAPEQVDALCARTEGWAAGLYLAGLSLRSQPADRFVADFAGDDRHVVDYLGGEVLGGLDDATRRFLLETSILERLTGDLCDAVTDGSGGGAVLDGLERSNLFIVPLDARREWYRYHTLFRELLRYELERTDAGASAGLHRRAATWYRSHGMAVEAVDHSISGHDIGTATEVISAAWLTLVNGGQIATVVGWVDALRAEGAVTDAGLALAGAWAMRGVGRLEDAEELCRVAERAGHQGRLPDGTACVDSAVAMIRALIGLARGNVGAAARAAERAAAIETDVRSRWHATASLALGLARYWQGDPDAARPPLRRALTLGPESGQHPAALLAMGRDAVIALDADGAEEGLEAGRAAEAYAANHGLADYPHAMPAALAVGRGLFALGRLDEAEGALGRARRLAERGRAALQVAETEIALADLRRAQGRGAEAASHARRAELALADCPDPGMLAGRRDTPAVPPHPPAAPGGALTSRELALLALLPTSLSQRELAGSLHVSPNTLKTHLRAIYRKLGATGRADAVGRARHLGLISRR